MRKLTDWRSQGKEPDYRFSLANERTFLAWIRTALALMAGAVILDQVAGHYAGQPLLSLASWLACGVAGLLSGFAFQRWKTNEIAMRHNQPLPASRFISGVSVGLTLVTMVLMLALLRHP